MDYNTLGCGIIFQMPYEQHKRFQSCLHIDQQLCLLSCYRNTPRSSRTDVTELILLQPFVSEIRLQISFYLSNWDVSLLHKRLNLSSQKTEPVLQTLFFFFFFSFTWSSAITRSRSHLFNLKKRMIQLAHNFPYSFKFNNLQACS